MYNAHALPNRCIDKYPRADTYQQKKVHIALVN